MNLLRTVACAFVLLIGATESAADGAWRIVQTAGEVKAGGTGFMPAAVQSNQHLPNDAWIETGTSGRVVLARGLETIALGPSSRVQLPSEPFNGNTQVLQTIGSALYQVGKQKAPHFQVDTPYLAAVVKGTTFVVTVSETGSSVDVSEGLVQVATPDGADAAFVHPGFSGVVTRHDPGNVVVVGMGHLRQPSDGASPKASNKPHADGTAKSIDSHSATASNQSAVIAAPIGDVVLDVKEVSGGLATSIEAPTGATDNTTTAQAAGIGASTADVADTDTATSSVDAASGGAISLEPVSDLGIAMDPVSGGSNGNGNAGGLGGSGSGGGLGGGSGGGKLGKLIPVL